MTVYKCGHCPGVVIDGACVECKVPASVSQIINTQAGMTMNDIRFGAKLCDTHGCLTNVKETQAHCQKCTIKNLTAEAEKELAMLRAVESVAQLIVDKWYTYRTGTIQEAAKALLQELEG